MANPVFEAAKIFSDNWVAAGKAVGEIDFSTNRFGQNSAYFDVAGHGRFRVSDHSCNDDFRVNERTVTVDRVTAHDVARFIALDAKAADELVARKANEIAERDAFEAPFKARFLAAKEHERHAVVCEMRPYLTADKAARKEITTRWLKG